MQNPKNTLIEKSFSVFGLQTRTKNIDERDYAKSKIIPLWSKFKESDLMSYIDEGQPFVYGVYSDYDSDHNGFYSVTAGINNNKLNTHESLHEVIIQPGHYLVFEANGNQPEAIINTWKYIWNYFSDSTHPPRIHSTDFEKYISDQKMEIYIAVAD